MDKSNHHSSNGSLIIISEPFDEWSPGFQVPFRLKCGASTLIVEHHRCNRIINGHHCQSLQLQKFTCQWVCNSIWAVYGLSCISVTFRILSRVACYPAAFKFDTNFHNKLLGYSKQVRFLQSDFSLDYLSAMVWHMGRWHRGRFRNTLMQKKRLIKQF